VTGTLFVTNQDVADFLRIHQRVVGWQDCATWQTKDGVNAK
jgi:hypothetical protein